MHQVSKAYNCHLFLSLLDLKPLLHTSYTQNLPFHYSATSVDVEEHLYKLANNSGITVITSSQVENLSVLTLCSEIVEIFA